VDAFSDWRAVLGGGAFAIIVTFPAASVYFRTTIKKPLPSYFYSCIVKFLSSCIMGPILVSGLLSSIEFAKDEQDALNISWIAALATEMVEFIFDFSRLIILFKDPPGEMDVYQNVRWNIDLSDSWRCGVVCLAFLPLSLLMFLMWVFVLIANFLSLFEVRAKWYFYLITFLFTLFGGISLLAMMCYCSKHKINQGEETGVGRMWSRFKIVAVDTPSWITAILNPSTLFWFWLGETINDAVPFVVKKYESYSNKEPEINEEGSATEHSSNRQSSAV